MAANSSAITSGPLEVLAIFNGRLVPGTLATFRKIYLSIRGAFETLPDILHFTILCRIDLATIEQLLQSADDQINCSNDTISDQEFIEQLLPNWKVAMWEDEFFNSLMQEEIIESGSWHQGVFDAIENADEVYAQSLLDDENRRAKRSARVQDVILDESELLDDLYIARSCLAYALLHNGTHSVHCRDVVHRDHIAWAAQKASVDQRIAQLRRKLNAARDIRKHLRQSKPNRRNASDDDAKTFDENTVIQNGCECQLMLDEGDAKHPLKGSEWDLSELSFNELLTIKDAQRNHINLFKRGGGAVRNRRARRRGRNKRPAYGVKAIKRFRKMLRNVVYNLPESILEQLSAQLNAYKTCSGSEQCDLVGKGVFH